MRMHPYYTERMLARPAALARIGAIASLTHERCDGSGYHRGLTGPAIPTTARILAAACAFRAMTEPRPHRPALTAKQAAAELRAEVRAGRLDGDAVDAVLAAAGQARGKRRTRPGRAHPPRDRGPDPHRPRRLDPPSRPTTRHHPQDGRDPHRAHLHQDRRVHPGDRHAVRAAARPARQPRTARSVGRTPDDATPAIRTVLLKAPKRAEDTVADTHDIGVVGGIVAAANIPSTTADRETGAKSQDVPSFAAAAHRSRGAPRRDFGGLAAAMHDDVHLRALLPRGFQWYGRAGVQGAFSGWFDDFKEFELVDAAVDGVGPRLHLGWRLRVRAARRGVGGW